MLLHRSVLLAAGLSATALAAPLMADEETIQARSILPIPLPISLSISVSLPLPTPQPTPTVTAPSPPATYIGSANKALVEKFEGVPYAIPPVGPNRLTRPSAIPTPLGIQHVDGAAQSCPQMGSTPNTTLLGPLEKALLKEIPILKIPKAQSEDCLTMRIQRPLGTKAGAKLPVLFYIYGGGFTQGSYSWYDGTPLIQQSIAEGAPIVYVAVNYRVSGWGFLGGAEIKKAGAANLGLLDQRLALEWVADNIDAFGGDPSKVTIWGESAGSISVFDQMLLYGGDNTYKGNPLFRGAIMDSGSVIGSTPIDSAKPQNAYDAVVAFAGCSGAADTLQCLRELPYQKFKAAVTSLPGQFSYSYSAFPYAPRPDGVTILDSADALVQAGKFAQVPFIVGDQEDEGTLFSLVQLNLTTTDTLTDYIHDVYFPSANRSLIADLVSVYPDNAIPGSPFRTGILNNAYPQFKRLAAIFGDFAFTLTRRSLLDTAAKLYPKLPTYSYLNTYFHGLPVLGTFHGTDVLVDYEYLPGNAAQISSAYYLNFVNTLDPNQLKIGRSPLEWPKWGTNHTLMHVAATEANIIADNFRANAYKFYRQHKSQLRI